MTIEYDENRQLRMKQNKSSPSSVATVLLLRLFLHLLRAFLSEREPLDLSLTVPNSYVKPHEYNLLACIQATTAANLQPNIIAHQKRRPDKKSIGIETRNSCALVTDRSFVESKTPTRQRPLHVSLSLLTTLENYKLRHIFPFHSSIHPFIYPNPSVR